MHKEDFALDNLQFYLSLFFIVCPYGVIVKAMDCGGPVNKFDLQLRYCLHFPINTLGKGMNPLIFPAIG